MPIVYVLILMKNPHFDADSTHGMTETAHMADENILGSDYMISPQKVSLLMHVWHRFYMVHYMVGC